MKGINQLLFNQYDFIIYHDTHECTITKKGAVWYVRCLVVIVLILSLILLKTTVGVSVGKSYEKGSVSKWLSAFTSHEFETCDRMVSSDTDRISTNDKYVLGTNSASVDIYKSLLDATANSITNVNAIGQKDGKTQIVVSIKPYQKATGINLNEGEVKDITNKYVEGDIKEKEFKEKLQALYLDSFNKTVPVQGENQTITIKYTITEKNTEIVEGVYDFVYTIMEKSNLLYNLNLFEESIESTFSTYLTEMESANDESIKKN